MYVYIRSEPGLYTVGFYGPDGRWEAESDHSSTEEAAQRVMALNGGAEIKIPSKDRCDQLLTEIDRICQPQGEDDPSEYGIPTYDEEVMNVLRMTIRGWVCEFND